MRGIAFTSETIAAPAKQQTGGRYTRAAKLGASVVQRYAGEATARLMAALDLQAAASSRPDAETVKQLVEKCAYNQYGSNSKDQVVDQSPRGQRRVPEVVVVCICSSAVMKRDLSHALTEADAKCPTYTNSNTQGTKI